MNVDPHEYHYLEVGPIQVIGQWQGICRCGQLFRGISREDIYLKSQTHIDNHNDGGGDAA